MEQPDLRLEIIKTLGEIGPGAKAALPLLKDILAGHSYLGRERTEQAIAKIEAAK
jgi:hypothetical protein